MGNEVNIMEPFSHLCNEWIGIAFCVVFCCYPNPHIYSKPSCNLIINGNIVYFSPFGQGNDDLSDHIWLNYCLSQVYPWYDKKSLWKCDANGFCEIGIKIDNEGSSLVKKCGLRVVYKKDIEDLNSTMVQCSNNSIIPYTGLKSP